MPAELILVDAATVRPVRAAAGLGPERTGDDDPRAAHFAAKKGKRVVGVVSIVPDARDGQRARWRMVGLYVHEGARGEGTGGMLVRAAKAIATNRGGGLWCTDEADGAAFLASQGFEPTDDGALVARPDEPRPADDD